jgi:ribosomal protein S18 acetylase RimI-like enzyme
MHVSTRLRGKGIGTKILMLIESEARKRKCKIIRLQVFKENPAKRLYEKLGYKIKKDIKSSVLMEKKI